MSELVLIAPTEMATAFRLAGVAVLPARTPAEVWEHVRDLQSHAEAKIVLLPEHLATGWGRREEQQVLDSDQPVFIPLPLTWQAQGDPRADFERRLGRILGCRIRLTSQVPGRRRKASSP